MKKIIFWIIALSFIVSLNPTKNPTTPSTAFAGERIIGARSKQLDSFKRSLRERNGSNHRVRDFESTRDYSDGHRYRRHRDRHSERDSNIITNQNTIIILNNEND